MAANSERGGEETGKNLLQYNTTKLRFGVLTLIHYYTITSSMSIKAVKLISNHTYVIKAIASNICYIFTPLLTQP